MRGRGVVGADILAKQGRAGAADEICRPFDSVLPQRGVDGGIVDDADQLAELLVACTARRRNKRDGSQNRRCIHFGKSLGSTASQACSRWIRWLRVRSKHGDRARRVVRVARGKFEARKLHARPGASSPSSKRVLQRGASRWSRDADFTLPRIAAHPIIRGWTAGQPAGHRRDAATLLRHHGRAEVHPGGSRPQRSQQAQA